MATGEFDTSDAHVTSIDKLKADLEAADRVNGQLVRLIARLYHGAPGSIEETQELLRQHELLDGLPTEEVE